MTIPTGHPDYQSYAQWRGQVFSAGGIAVTSAAPVTTAEYVINFASVFMRAQMTGGTGVKITFNWYTDATLATLVESYFWELSGVGAELAVIVPALANYLSAVVSTTNAGTQNVALTLAPTNVAAPAIRYPATAFPNFAIASPIPASGVLTAVGGRIAEGPGQLHVNVAGHNSNFNAYIQELDQTGTPVNTIFRQESTGAAINASFRGGPRPLELNITNEDAANAHNFDYYFIVMGE